MKNIKLNLGCGQIRPDYWLNTDSSINSLMQKLPFGKRLASLLGLKGYNSTNMVYMNLNKRWRKFRDASVSVIYASHLFEHLSIRSRAIFLEEATRVLVKGGTIRLVVPDMEAHARDYIKNLESSCDSKAIEQFLWTVNLHREGQYPDGRKIHNIIGRLQGYPHQHKYMYDRYLLTELLHSHHFVNIVLCEFGVSESIESIADVESDHKMSYGHSLYIEATKA
jgi:hypothetical protein